MQTGDIISLIGTIAAVTAGIFAILQWRKSNKIRPAEFISQIIEKLRFDKNIVETIYMIEYGVTWYDSNFHNSDIERKIDALFSYFTYICYLYDTKNISEEEFYILEYEVRRICSTVQAQTYLWNFYHWSKRIGAMCSFQNLIDYLRNKVLTTDERKRFDSNDSKMSGYTKRLNF
jgi:hypothetical protein